MLEYSVNYSVGRGTETPFEHIGADWIHGAQLAESLNARGIPGVRAEPVTFTPTASYFAGKKVEGVAFTVTDRDAFSSTRLGLELAMVLAELYPGKMDWEVNKKLIGSEAVIRALKAGGDAVKASEEGMVGFQSVRAKYLLYR